MCRQMMQIQYRLWNVSFVAYLIGCFMFLFDSVFFLVAFSRNVCLLFYVHCFCHVRYYVVFDLLFRPSTFLFFSILLSFQTHLWPNLLLLFSHIPTALIFVPLVLWNYVLRHSQMVITSGCNKEFIGQCRG